METKTILIVDDMPKVVSRLSQLYNSIGLKVVGEAANGVEALHKVKSLQPDFVSLDIIMPEMDGVECYRRLRDSEEFAGKRPLVFFVSYLSTEQKFVEAYQEEIPQHLFLPKNLTAEAVRNCLSRLSDVAFIPEIPINQPQV